MAQWLLRGLLWALVGGWAWWEQQGDLADPQTVLISCAAVLLLWLLGVVPRAGYILQPAGAVAVAVLLPGDWSLAAVALSAAESLDQSLGVAAAGLGAYAVIAVRSPDVIKSLGVLLPLLPAIGVVFAARHQERQLQQTSSTIAALEAQISQQREALVVQQEHNDSLQQLMRADQEIGGKLDPEEILECIPRHAAAIAHATGCLCYWLDDASGNYLLHGAVGSPGHYPQFLPFQEARESVRSGTNLRVPLVIEGKLWGCLILLGKQTEVEGRMLRGSFTPEDFSFASVFARAAMSHVSVAIAHSEMRQMALTDMLTGIYNRQYFLRRLKEEIARAQRYSESFAILFFDIDHFKKFNDTWGHQAGDETLTFIAQESVRWARESDVVARWGGEEFVVLLPRTTKEQARIAAERLRQQIAHSETRYGTVTISLGVASFPGDAQDAQDLINRADEAAYQSKAGGRNRVTCYQAQG